MTDNHTDLDRIRNELASLCRGWFVLGYPRDAFDDGRYEGARLALKAFDDVRATLTACRMGGDDAR